MDIFNFLSYLFILTLILGCLGAHVMTIIEQTNLEIQLHNQEERDRLFQKYKLQQWRK